MQTKVSVIRTAMQADDWQLALRLAARLPRLGEHGPAIKRAHECYSNAAFYRQLGRDPDALIEVGKAALVDRFAH